MLYSLKHSVGHEDELLLTRPELAANQRVRWFHTYTLLLASLLSFDIYKKGDLIRAAH